MHRVENYPILVGPEELPTDLRKQRISPTAIFNVNDSYPRYFVDLDTQVYWYPINELSQWGYGPFFWFKRLMDNVLPHASKERPVIVHCAAGAGRAPMMTFAYLLSKGLGLRGACFAMGENPDSPANVMKDFNRNVAMGVIPGNLLDMYQLMDEHSTYSLMGLLQQMHMVRWSH